MRRSRVGLELMACTSCTWRKPKPWWKPTVSNCLSQMDASQMDYVMSSLGAPRSGTTRNESKAGEEEDVVTKDGVEVGMDVCVGSAFSEQLV